MQETQARGCHRYTLRFIKGITYFRQFQSLGGLTTEHWNIIVTASDLGIPTVPQRNAARMPEETPMRRPSPSRLAAVSVLALLLCALASPGEQKAVITELSISGPTEHT
ncbi:MAG: hypothetical protein IJJ33_11520, partial [Victivallales bacterium]|nr:hypothetical protein [Victivallales bacterium]